MTQFYIYIHKKPNGTPFYVGKGHGKRAYKKRDRNPHHTAILKKYGDAVQIEIIHADSEAHAFQMEREHIAMYREQGYRLANLTDGGEGVTGYQFEKELVEKLANINKTKTRTDEFKQQVSKQWSGVKRGPQSEEHRKKNAEAKRGNTFRRGSTHTPESIEKMKAAQKNRTSAHPSGISGVTWNNRVKKWRVQMTKNKKTTFYGWFACFLDACACRLTIQQY